MSCVELLYVVMRDEIGRLNSEAIYLAKTGASRLSIFRVAIRAEMVAV